MTSQSQKQKGDLYRWYVVGVLTFAYLVSFLDRQILALMVGPIQEDLMLSDTQMSLLMGLAFSIFYIFMAVPLGRLADNSVRRNIIVGGVTLWSLMTAACGLAGSYWHLFLARMGVGVGEATLTPSATSMIADYFPSGARGKALATYNAGVSLGTGFAMVFGGLIITYVSTSERHVLPIVGSVAAWQYVFFLVALPGLLVVLLMLTVREPARQETSAAAQNLSFRDVLTYLYGRRKIYIPLFLGMSVNTIVGYALFSWIPTSFARVHGWTMGDIGLGYGLIILATGPLGVFIAGSLIDKLHRAGQHNAELKVALLSIAICLPGVVYLPLAATGQAALIAMIPASIGPAMTTASGSIAVINVTPNQIRGQTMALYLLTISLLGLSLGPTAVALLTDYVFVDPAMIDWSISCVVIASSLFSAIMLWRCLDPFAEGVRNAVD
ncbi:MAG: MFS transporter [Halieaceae bacterium]|nr:MAG: MFS transporter [Halieaceae bacterium]